jgi:hypothetical protein
MLNPIQVEALAEIDRQTAIIRAADIPDTEVIPVEGNLQTAINDAPEGVILDLIGRTHVQAIVVDKPLTLRNGIIQAPPNTNDIVILRGDHINLHQGLIIRGDGTTKRGIMNDAMFVEMDGIEVRNIRRAGQENQAIAMWNSPGPLVVRNSVLEAGSIPFLAGGSRPTIENTIPTGLLFDNVLFTCPLEWRGQDVVRKNCFELKSAQDVVVRNSILENCWTQGQTGSGIVLTPVNYGNSPEAVVQNVLFENCTIRNVGNGINMLGFGQQELPTRRSNNIRFINCNWEISRFRNGGQGALVMIGKEPELIRFIDNGVMMDGDAMIRVSDTRPINDFEFTGENNVNQIGTYGVFTPIGSRGVGWNTIFPGGLLEGNTLYGAHSIFRTNFPNNNYIL